MSPIEPRDAGDAVISPTDPNASGWNFQAWAIAIPLGIIFLCFTTFAVYYWCHRKEVAQRRAEPNPEQLPAYKPPLADAKGGPPAYVMGTEQASLETGEDGLAVDGRADPAGPAEGGDSQGERERAPQAQANPGSAALAAPTPAHVA